MGVDKRYISINCFKLIAIHKIIVKYLQKCQKSVIFVGNLKSITIQILICYEKMPYMCGDGGRPPKRMPLLR